MSSVPILVTGAGGFIGSHLVRRLRAQGHPVLGIDAFRGTTTREIAYGRLGGLLSDPEFELAELDLTDAALGDVVARFQPTAIFHLAARPGARDADTAALVRDNVQATESVIAAATAAEVTDLMFTSSSSVYGDAGAGGPSREHDPTAPLSPYAETKLAAEGLCLAAPMRSRVVRLFTVYGPGQRPDMAFQRFIAAAMSATSAPLYQRAQAARDFTYVGDAVEGILRAWEHGTAPIYNISGGEVVALETAWRMIEQLTGAPVTTHGVAAPPQPEITRADLTLARSHLGYQPQVSLWDGLRAQVAAESLRR